MRKKTNPMQSEPFITRSMISNPTQNTELSVKRNPATNTEIIHAFKEKWELGKNGFFIQKNIKNK